MKRNILAVVAGVILGGIVNAGLVAVGPHIVPLPEGADVSTPEGLAKSMKLFTPANFIAPFLAHALGTLAGAFTTAKIAASSQMKLALGIGAFFLIGGITMVFLAGGPLWFIALDLLGAYLPMGFLGGILAGTKPTPAAQPAA